jgi:hypothetical protein
MSRLRLQDFGRYGAGDDIVMLLITLYYFLTSVNLLHIERVGKPPG